MRPSLYLSFRNKLLGLFILFSVIPLAVTAVFVSNTVQRQYKQTLLESFTQHITSQQKLLSNHFANQKEWIKSIAAQDLILAEMEKYSKGAGITEDSLFSSLVSIRRENPFIDRIFIIDTKGDIVTSSTTDDIGSKLTDRSFVNLVNEQRSPYFSRIFTNERSTRIIRLSTPFIRKSDRKIIGALIAEFNIASIKNLVADEPNTTNLPKEKLAETYIVDEDGYPLTELTKDVKIPLNQTVPYILCKNKATGTENSWTSYANQTVFGLFICGGIDDLNYTVIVSQPIEQAFSVSNQITYTISILSIAIGLLLVIVIFRMSRSITKPIKLLQQGATQFGKGNMDINIQVNTHDELEDLGKSFNEMAAQVRQLFTNLKRQDNALNSINAELQKEKDTISAEKNKLKIIISAITDAVIAVDLEHKIVIFNRAAEEMTGLREKDVINKPVDQIISLSNQDADLNINDYCPANVEDQERIIAWKDLHLRVAGKEIPINMLSGEIKDGSSINLGTILTIHDISHDKELEDMKLDFVSMAAHELRTPITSIRGYTSVLSEEIKEVQIEQTNEWLSLLDRVSISSEQLLALVENLLNVTKIEKGVLSISCKPENWNQCISEVVDVLTQRAKNKNITITVNPIDPNLSAYVDKMRINEVTTNLITNAINYTPESGRIEVSTKITDDKQWIETTVKDNGHGIPKKAQTHLFEKFFRVSGPLEQGSKGNGLGLYISKSIVTMHGGKIWVESDADQGAAFTFTVPVSA